MSNRVYIATSIDGYIADREGGLEWLEYAPQPRQGDLGYATFMSQIDALVMGKNTFIMVDSFDIEWPYDKPVYVVSSTLTELPKKYSDKVFLIQGTPEEIVKELNSKGLHNLYIDGGQTIQSFLSADLIDEMIITTIPILLGGGVSLFGSLDETMKFEAVESHIDGGLAQTQYKRVHL
jgi:dihydrofolate reductase